MKSPWYDTVYKQTLMGAVVILVVFLLYGCSHHVLYGKDANTIRAAIDECHQNKLEVLLFQRPDHTVYAIRCTPPKSEVEQTVTVREKTPINLFRHFIDANKVLIEQPAIQ